MTVGVRRWHGADRVGREAPHGWGQDGSFAMGRLSTYQLRHLHRPLCVHHAMSAVHYWNLEVSKLESADTAT